MADCRDFKNGRCQYSHEAAQIEGEEVKRSGPLTNQQRDYRMREQPKNRNPKPEEDEDEEDSKQEGARPMVNA